MSKQSVQDLILAEVRELSQKIDKILEEKIPELEKNTALAKQQAGVVSTFITLIGGAVAVTLSWFHK